MEMIHHFLHNSIGITDAYIIGAVTASARIFTLPKGEFLIKQGQTADGLFFLLSGLLRGYFVDYNGKDITDCFGFRYGTTAMPFSDMMNPSPICIEALEDSRILIIPTETMRDILSNSMEAVHIYNKLLLAGAAEHWEIKTAMYQYSAAERYEWFVQKYDGLIDRVPHKHIASFLGMSPVTLSRVRAQLK